MFFPTFLAQRSMKYAISWRAGRDTLTLGEKIVFKVDSKSGGYQLPAMSHQLFDAVEAAASSQIGMNF